MTHQRTITSKPTRILELDAPVRFARDWREALATYGTARVARHLRGQLLTPNLSDVPRVFDADSERDVFEFRALIQVVYWQIADKMHGGSTIRRCPCGALFFPTDRRQKFCPPPPGTHESRCGKRLRQPRYQCGARRAT